MFITSLKTIERLENLIFSGQYKHTICLIGLGTGLKKNLNYLGFTNFKTHRMKNQFFFHPSKEYI